jgi:hypothetical protein
MANNSVSVSMCGMIMLNGGACKAKAKYDIMSDTGENGMATCGRHLKIALQKYEEPSNAFVFLLLTDIRIQIINPLQIIPPPPPVCDENCSICMNSISDEDTITLPCTHVIHKECMDKWTITCNNGHKDTTCPLCRTVYLKFNGFSDLQMEMLSVAIIRYNQTNDMTSFTNDILEHNLVLN